MNLQEIWRAAMYRFYTLLWPLVSLFGAKAKFAFVYRMNLWGNPESISGDGSTMAYTENLRNKLPLLFERFDIKRVFDAPCGDYNWFQHVQREGISYTGGDIVDAMAKENQQKFGDGETDFVFFDIRESVFPKADIWLCRDCLFHLSNCDVMAALENFSASDVPYVLTTSHFEVTENSELPHGGFRMLNLELPPYNLPQPSFLIEDWVEGFPRRMMGLWTREEIQIAVAKWKQEAVQNNGQ